MTAPFMRALLAWAFSLSAPGLANAQLAADGVVLIDQVRAVAGGVTPGDDPGFPVTISRAGSYRLSGNLRMTNPTATGIKIAASHVTLDLNGFVIAGPADVCFFNPRPVWCGDLGTGIGIDATGNVNTTIVNGAVRAIAGYGLWLGAGARVEGLVITRNQEAGVAAGDLFLSRSRISDNGWRADAPGVACQVCLVMESVFVRNAGFAISALQWVDLANNVFVGIKGVDGSVRQVAPNLCGDSLCQ